MAFDAAPFGVLLISHIESSAFQLIAAKCDAVNAYLVSRADNCLVYKFLQGLASTHVGDFQGESTGLIPDPIIVPKVPVCIFSCLASPQLF